MATKKTKKIRYRSGYKYQLAKAYSDKIKIKPKKDIDIAFIKLDEKGKLTIVAGYAWDGPTGLIDTKRNMRASLVHDALYQLMRLKELSRTDKDKADKLFEKNCIQDGIPKLLAHSYYWVLKAFGKDWTDPKKKKEVHTAP